MSDGVNSEKSSRSAIPSAASETQTSDSNAKTPFAQVLARYVTRAPPNDLNIMDN
jgi:hypothetical protein